MAKPEVTTEQLNQLAQYQKRLDWTVEYISPDCWSLAGLRKEAAEFNQNAADCWVSLDGEEPDGTFDDQTEAEWLFYAEVINYCISVRKNCKKLTEAQLDVVEGVVAAS